MWATNIPVGSVGPFNLSDTPDGAVISFDVDGTINNTTTGQQTSYTGTFSATFDGETVAQLFTSLPVNTPFSGTIAVNTVSSPTPEPASLLLVGAGLIGVGTLARRRRKA